MSITIKYFPCYFIFWLLSHSLAHGAPFTIIDFWRTLSGQEKEILGKEVTLSRFQDQFLEMTLPSGINPNFRMQDIQQMFFTPRSQAAEALVDKKRSPITGISLNYTHYGHTEASANEILVFQGDGRSVYVDPKEVLSDEFFERFPDFFQDRDLSIKGVNTGRNGQGQMSYNEAIGAMFLVPSPMSQQTLEDFGVGELPMAALPIGGESYQFPNQSQPSQLAVLLRKMQAFRIANLYFLVHPDLNEKFKEIPNQFEIRKKLLEKIIYVALNRAKPAKDYKISLNDLEKFLMKFATNLGLNAGRMNAYGLGHGMLHESNVDITGFPVDLGTLRYGVTDLNSLSYNSASLRSFIPFLSFTLGLQDDLTMELDRKKDGLMKTLFETTPNDYQIIFEETNGSEGVKNNLPNYQFRPAGFNDPATHRKYLKPALILEVVQKMTAEDKKNLINKLYSVFDLAHDLMVRSIQPIANTQLLMRPELNCSINITHL
jgi:hypothetical protein